MLFNFKFYFNNQTNLCLKHTKTVLQESRPRLVKPINCMNNLSLKNEFLFHCVIAINDKIMLHVLYIINQI
jgi:hypothetical protein